MDGLSLAVRSKIVRRELPDCDCYRMLEGDMRAVNACQGEYMSEYSWAELTAGRPRLKCK